MADNRKLSALPAAPALGADDLMYVVRGGLSSRASLGQFVTFAAATMQPAADNLTALAGLEGLAGRLPYFTGTGAMATTPTTSFGRSWLSLADGAAGRSALAAASQTDLDALSTATASALDLRADKAISITGSGLVTGGGGLSASRTLSVAEASDAEALAGTASDKAMTPRRTKTAVDAAVAAAVESLQASVDDLATGQTAGTVAAENWTALAAFSTIDRAEGDYARVIGIDGGTHTDPVTGSTVTNRGAYRWSASPAGWVRVGNLDSDDAAGFAEQTAASAAAALTNLPKLLTALGGDLSRINTSSVGDETLDDGTFPPGTWGQILADIFPASGILTKLGINVSGAASVRFFEWRPDTQTVIWAVDLDCLTGQNRFVSDVDFPLHTVEAGNRLGIYILTDGVEVRTGTAGGTSSFFSASAPEEGTEVPLGALGAWAEPFAISYELVWAAAPQIRSRLRVVSQSFLGTSAPSDWTLGSAFSVNDGLLSSGTGGWNNYASHNQVTAVGQREIAARVSFLDPSSKWGLGVRSVSLFNGGLLILDGGTGKLGLYDWFNPTSGNPGSLKAETSLPVLDNYLARIRVEDTAIIGEVLSLSGQLVAVVSSSDLMSPSGDAIAFKGMLSAVHFAGSVHAHYVEMHHGHPKRSKLGIVTDSNGAGTVAAYIGKTWPMRLGDRRPQKDIVVSAVGGDTNQWHSGRLPLDFSPFQFEKLLLALTSNYSVQAAWRADTKAMIDTISAAGTEPLLATALPTNNMALITAMNEDILGGYFGNIRVVDVAAAVTANGERTAWATGMQAGDNIHLSYGGHVAIAEYITANFPWLIYDTANALIF